MFDPEFGQRKKLKEWQEKYGKVIGCYLFRDPILIVTDLDMLKEIFVKQFHDMPARHLMGGKQVINRILRKSLFFSEGSNWQRIRRIMTPSFSSGKLKQLVGHLNRHGHCLLDNVYQSALDGKRLAAKDVFGAYSLDLIAAMAFGLDINSQSNFDLPFIKNAKSLATFGRSTQLKMLLIGIFPQLSYLFQLFDVGTFDYYSCDYFEKSIHSIIAQRKGKEGEEIPSDFLQFLLNAETEEDDSIKEKKLTMKEIASQSITFILAGYETTSTALQYISYELARNPSIQAKLWEEVKNVVGDGEDLNHDHIMNLKYMTAVICEALRMYPPIHNLTRHVNKACVINGIPIPENAAIMIPIYNIGRDPEVFEEPDVFKPERFLDDGMQKMNDISFLPFGFGPKRCIGMRLALMEIKVALFHMLRSVVIHDALPANLIIDDVSAFLVSKVPIELSFKVRS